jgi:hypothetical protein
MSLLSRCLFLLLPLNEMIVFPTKRVSHHVGSENWFGAIYFDSEYWSHNSLRGGGHG